MPVDALRSVSEHFDRILRHVRPRQLADEIARADRAFHVRHFKGYRPEKIGRGRIKRIAEKAVFEAPGHELFANLIILQWNDAHPRLYREMVAHVQTIDEDVESIEEIPDDAAHRMIDDLLERHDRRDVYICVRLNGVRFREEIVQSRLVRGEPAPTDTSSEPTDAEDSGGEASEALGEETGRDEAPSEPRSEEAHAGEQAESDRG